MTTFFRNMLFAGLLLGSLQARAYSQAAAPRQSSSDCKKVSFPGRVWQQDRSLRAAHWSEERLRAAGEYAASLHDESLMTLECGRLVDTWGDTSKKLTTFSVRKSLIRALFGIYATEGKIDLNETLEHLGIDDAPNPLTKEERQARVIDLLRARSGIFHAASFETDFQRKIRPTRGSHAPGTFWFYNNWDFNALNTIFEKKTGQRISDAFYKRIALPTGMEDFTPADVYYFGDQNVSEHSAYMIQMTTRDMARFGLLYLNDGKWKATAAKQSWFGAEDEVAATLESLTFSAVNVEGVVAALHTNRNATREMDVLPSDLIDAGFTPSA